MKDKTTRKLYFGIFAALFYAFLLMPLMGDDMTFRAQTANMGLADIFEFAYSYGNGRFLGNSLILIILKSMFFRGLIKAAVLVGITYLCAQLCDIKSVTGRVLTAFLVLFPACSFIAQAYAWSAGFTNYTIPVFMILLILQLIKTGNESGIRLCIRCAAIVVLGVASQLFSENTTVFNVLLAAFISVMCIVKHEKPKLFMSIAYFSSTLGGAALMYLIPKLSDTGDKMEWYRGSVLDEENNLVQTALSNLSQIFIEISWLLVLWFVLSFSIIVLVKNNEQLAPIKRRRRRFVFGILCAHPVLMLTSAIMLNEDSGTSSMYYLFASLTTFIYLFVMFIVICRWLPKEQKKTSIILFLLTGASLAPLLVVSPIGIRTFYLSYMIMAILAVYLAKAAGKYIMPLKYELTIKKVSCVALAAAMSIVMLAYTEASYSSYARDKYIRAEIAAGETVIHIPPILHERLVFNGNKIYKTEGIPSLHYRDEPGDVEFIIEDSFTGWLSEYYSNDDNPYQNKAPTDPAMN